MRDVTDLSKIRNAARQFIERYGDDAPRQANIRASELQAMGQLEGHARWQLIERESDQLLAQIIANPRYFI